MKDFILKPAFALLKKKKFYFFLIKKNVFHYAR